MEGDNTNQEDPCMKSLYQTSANLVIANRALVDAIRSIEINFHEREQALVAREAQLGKGSDLRGGEEKETLSLDPEELQKLKDGLRKEKNFLHIGRATLNQDIKRHQAQMKAAMAEVKKNAEEERLEFFDAVLREIELFKLPSAAKTFESEKVNGLLAEIKEIGDDCLKQ